ncbi:MAG: peptidoglycan-binding protein [Bacteroidota bacterium]
MASKKTLQRIKDIQARLGLVADGIIGPATLTALENVIEKALGPPEEPVVHTMRVSRMGINQLVKFEIVSKSYYNRFLKSPIWPGGESGVTIGIGYDVGYQPKRQIEKDWKGQIDDVDLNALLKVAGLKKGDAKKKIKKLKNISIPFDAAQEVFLTATLPNWAKITHRTYPGVEKLPADAQAMLLSLVYNRGPSLSQRSSRREMRAIKPLVAAQDLPRIAAQVRSMKRIWEGKGLGGLLKRRDKEAQIIENARPDSSLPEGEIILV